MPLCYSKKIAAMVADSCARSIIHSSLEIIIHSQLTSNVLVYCLERIAKYIIASALMRSKFDIIMLSYKHIFENK